MSAGRLHYDEMDSFGCDVKNVVVVVGDEDGVDENHVYYFHALMILS